MQLVRQLINYPKVACAAMAITQQTIASAEIKQANPQIFQSSNSCRWSLLVLVHGTPYPPYLYVFGVDQLQHARLLLDIGDPGRRLCRPLRFREWRAGRQVGEVVTPL